MCFHHHCAAGLFKVSLGAHATRLYWLCSPTLKKKDWSRDFFNFFFVCEQWRNAEDSPSWACYLQWGREGEMEFPCHILGLNLPDLDPAIPVLTLVAALTIQGYTITGIYKEPRFSEVSVDFEISAFRDLSWENLRKPAGKPAPQLLLQTQCCQCVCSSRSLFKILCLLGFSKYSPFVPIVIHTLFLSPLCDSVRVTSLFYFS